MLLDLFVELREFEHRILHLAGGSGSTSFPPSAAGQFMVLVVRVTVE
jgi:hypothetical protein